MYETGRAALSNIHITELMRLFHIYYSLTAYVKHVRVGYY